MPDPLPTGHPDKTPIPPHTTSTSTDPGEAAPTGEDAALPSVTQAVRAEAVGGEQAVRAEAVGGGLGGRAGGVVFVPVGGFLGAGKTTTLLAAARELGERGRRVAVVANDQGGELVDALFARAAVDRVSEVTGGCFCCRFDDLAEVVTTLVDDGVDTVLAEAVGSCTDLQATVVRPLRKYHGDRLTVAPLTAVVDPGRYRLFARAWDTGAESDLAYLYAHQLAEADIIAVNKIDTVPTDRLPALLADIHHRYPTARIVPLSATSGQVTTLLKELATPPPNEKPAPPHQQAPTRPTQILTTPTGPYTPANDTPPVPPHHAPPGPRPLVDDASDGPRLPVDGASSGSYVPAVDALTGSYVPADSASSGPRLAVDDAPPGPYVPAVDAPPGPRPLVDDASDGPRLAVDGASSGSYVPAVDALTGSYVPADDALSGPRPQADGASGGPRLPAVDALTGSYVPAGGGSAGGRGLAIDYDRYAAAEALLVWLDHVVVVSGGFRPARWATEVLMALSADCSAAGVLIGHAKIAVDTLGGLAKASLVEAGDPPRLDLTGPARADTGRAVLNLRVAWTPDDLDQAAAAAVQAADRACGTHSTPEPGPPAFRPAYPRPVHRLPA